MTERGHQAEVHNGGNAVKNITAMVYGSAESKRQSCLNCPSFD